MDASAIMHHMMDAATSAQEVLRHYFRKGLSVEVKIKAGLVTEADRESEKIIFEKLRAYGYDFEELGEETFRGSIKEVLNSQRPVWILDPLDGTTNFVHGFEFFAISLALWFEGRVQVGVICAPLLGEKGLLFRATRGQGAYLGSERLKVSRPSGLHESLLVTGFFAEDRDQFRDQMEVFARISPCCRGVRRTGSAALDLAYVARGIFNGFWESGLKPWDTAAGILLVEEAGGVNLNREGKPYNPWDYFLISGSQEMTRQILEKV